MAEASAVATPEMVDPFEKDNILFLFLLSILFMLWFTVCIVIPSWYTFQALAYRPAVYLGHARSGVVLSTSGVN